MKICKVGSRQSGFQISIPDNWSTQKMKNFLTSLNRNDQATTSKTITGPNGEFLNILITPLKEKEKEPTVQETADYFDGLSYKENLNVIDTGTIIVQKKEHFWAKYYRMTLFGKRQLQFFKKYSLFLNRIEYLITAGLWDAAITGKAPTDAQLDEQEEIYDKIIQSFEWQN